MNRLLENLKTLPLPQRIQLVESLWDSIAAELDKQPLSHDLKAEMNRRRKEYLRDPSTAVDWDLVRQRLEKRK